jgi:hypothetical protein
LFKVAAAQLIRIIARFSAHSHPGRNGKHLRRTSRDETKETKKTIPAFIMTFVLQQANWIEQDRHD